MFRYFSLTIVLFAIDRLTKIYMIENPCLDCVEEGFFSLHINENIAFSLPLMDWILFPLIAIIILALVWSWYKHWQKNTILIWPIGLIIIGAISNVIDRINYGGVIDFINVPFFTIFNISDIYISVGVVWVLWYSWFYKGKENI